MLVVIGRNMNSGDFKDTESWSKVEVPVLFLSAPAARSSRLKLLNSKEHNDFTWPIIQLIFFGQNCRC